MTPDEKIESLNLVLPEPIKLPPGVSINFSWVKVRGSRVFVSGHIALNADGSVYDVVGKVGSEVTIEQGYEAARQTGLSMCLPQARIRRRSKRRCEKGPTAAACTRAITTSSTIK